MGLRCDCCKVETCRWKLVHGDVFRPPRYLELLAALVGTGVQLALLVLSVILITIAGDSPPIILCHRSCLATGVQMSLRNMQSQAKCTGRGEGTYQRNLCRDTIHGAGDHCNSVHHLLCAHILCSRLCQVHHLHVLPLCLSPVCLIAHV